MEQGIPGEPGHHSGDDAPPPGPALAGLLAAQEAVAGALGGSWWSLPDAQAAESVRVSFGLLQQAQALFLQSLADLDTRPEAVPGAAAGTTGRTFLVHALRRTPAQAGADLRAATALHPNADPASGGLPGLGAALAAGAVSREHAAVAVSAMNRLPKKLLRQPLTEDDLTGLGITDQNTPDGSTSSDGGGRPLRCWGDLVDRLVTDHALAYDSGTSAALSRYLLDAADPDGSHSFDPDAVTRRGLRITTDRTGMMLIRGELDPATAAWFIAALDAFSAPDPARTETTDDGTLIQLKDGRTATQRRADALGTMARVALGALKDTSRGGEPPRILIYADATTLAHARAHHARSHHPETGSDHAEAEQARQSQPTGQTGSSEPTETGGQAEPAERTERAGSPFPPFAEFAEFATGGRIHPHLLAQLSCDATLQAAFLTPTGAVLDLGRDTRTITPAQRRALAARDRGCVIPACTAPAAWCEGHHIRYWRHGGTTDLGNLALLCQRHHTAVHSGIWTITMRDGIPWVIPPAWVDHQRRPLRNTYRYDTTTASHLGTQLRLNLDPRVGPDLGTGFTSPSRSHEVEEEPEDGPDPPGTTAA